MEKLQQQIKSGFDALATRGATLCIAFGLLPSLLFGYIGYSLLIEPGFSAIGEKQKTVASLEAEVAKGRAVELSEPDFKLEFKKTIELFYDSSPLAPVETEISNVLLGVQGVAKRFNVVLTNLNASSATFPTIIWALW